MRRRYRLITTPQRLEALKAELAPAPFIALDCETTSLDVHADGFKLVGLSVCGDGKTSYYIPTAHENFPDDSFSYQTPNLPVEQVAAFIRWCYGQVPVVWHNAAFDRAVIKKCLGIGFDESLAHDTKLALHKLDENAPQSLKERAKQFLGVEENKLKWKDVKKVVEAYWLSHVISTEKVDAVSEKTGRRYKKNLYTLADGWRKLLLEDWMLRATGAESIQYVFDYWKAFLSVLKRRSIAQYEGTVPKDFRYIPTWIGAIYAGDDAINTWLLWDVAQQKLYSLGLERLYQLEREVDDVMMRASYEGIPVDVAELERMQAILAERLEDTKYQAKGIVGQLLEPEELFGGHYNLDTILTSTQQLQTLLFDSLGFPVIESTATGKPSVAAGVLEKLLDTQPRRKPHLRDAAHEFIRAKQRIADIAKLKGTYTEGILKLMDASGRVHPSFNVTGTVSGRMSSNLPNLQQLPRLTPEEVALKPWLEGVDIRRAFVAPEGWTFVACDYEAMELRLTAALSQDEAMMRLIAEGRDLHCHTARYAFGVGLDLDDAAFKQRYKLERQAAKVTGFTLIYGGSAQGLSRQLAVSVGQAAALIEGYFRAYPGVKAWMDSVYAELEETGFVTYPEYGYVRRLSARKAPDWEAERRYQAALRSAQNSVVQGTAAFLVKNSAVQMARQFNTKGMRSRVAFQIHDEIGCLAPEGEALQTLSIMREAMTREFRGVTLTVSGDITRSMSKSASNLAPLLEAA